MGKMGGESFTWIMVNTLQIQENTGDIIGGWGRASE